MSHGIKAAVDMDETEKMISWLPLFHDMGLVGAVLFSLCHGYPLHLMTPTQFIKRPLLWLRGIGDARCTITTAPNFGYDYCLQAHIKQGAGALDLTCVKHFFIGAEPIRESASAVFATSFPSRASATTGSDRLMDWRSPPLLPPSHDRKPRPGSRISTLAASASISRCESSRRGRFDALDDGVPAGAVAVCTAGTGHCRHGGDVGRRQGLTRDR